MDGICAMTATLIRASRRPGGWLGKLLGRSRAPGGGQTWVLPNGASAEQLGERQVGLLVAWAEDSGPLDEGRLRQRWPPAVTMPAREPAAAMAVNGGHETDTDLLVNVERDHIQRALVRTGGNKKAAAQMLGLSRRALYRRLERLDLSGTISRRRQQSAYLGA